MKTCWILALLISSFPAFALSGGMQKAVVHAMRKVPCTDGQSSPGHHGIIGGIVGTGGVGSECIEYELFTETVRYTVRPHIALLLLLGDDVTIKLAGDELLLRTSQVPKNIHCTVFAMSLRGSEEEENEANKEWRRSSVCVSESGEQVACSAESESFR